MRSFFISTKCKDTGIREYLTDRIRISLIISLCLTIFNFNCNQNDQAFNKQTGKDTKNLSIQYKEYRNTLLRDLSSDPITLNPILSNDSPSISVIDLIFDPLISIDRTEALNPVSRLAERWEVSEDKLCITFYLRKGITWHDGKPFSAEDVKFTIETSLRRDIPAFGKRSLSETLDRVEIIDKYKIKFYFKYPWSPGLLYVGGTYIVPKHRLDEKGLAQEAKRRGLATVSFQESGFSRNPIGTGPYRFKEWKTTDHIKLERNDDYWDTENIPKIEAILFRIIPNRTVAYNIMKKGNLDVFNCRVIQYLMFERQEDLHENLVSLKYDQPSYYYIGWNLRPEKLFFTDKTVRRAMTHSIDRQSFIEKVNYGLGTIATGPFYFKSWAYNPTIKPLPYDLEKAAELLHRAGWMDHDGDGILDKDSIPFEFELLIPSSSPTIAQLAAIVQANLKKLGVTINIQMFEWSVYLERIQKGDFSAYIGGWGLQVDPDPYGIWHSNLRDGGNNHIAYSNKEVDRLIELGRKEYDRTKRQKLYWRIHEIIHEEQPYSFIHSPVVTYIFSKRVKNYDISPFGLFGFFPGQLEWYLEQTEVQ